MRTTQLWLVRHGEVEAAYRRVFGGRIDMGLSPEGHAQAAELARFLAPVHWDAIYASPMRRAQETLAPMLNGKPCVQLPGLREVDFGVWTGLGWQEVRDRFGMSAFDWLKELDGGTIPEAEPAGQFRERVQAALRRILEVHAGQRVGVVCHGGVIRMALALLLDLPLPQMAAFEIDYASVTVVDWRPDRVEVQLLNYTPWRPQPETPR